MRYFEKNSFLWPNAKKTAEELWGHLKTKFPGAETVVEDSTQLPKKMHLGLKAGLIGGGILGGGYLLHRLTKPQDRNWEIQR